MSLTLLYQAVRTDGAEGETARQLLDQAHWFTVNAEFDPKTGDALPQALSTFLTKVAEPKKRNGKTQDRLYRLTEHVRPALERLFRTLNENPRREHALMPVRAVRELDASSFIKLSTRPGRNIREKLAGKPYLQAVRRFQSVDLPENRLLKVFVSRLLELLKLRSDMLGESEDDLIQRIESWGFSDEAHAIGKWDNLPPNNTLLAHRDYRRVWDAWRRLQSLNDDLALDLSQLDVRCDMMRKWTDYGRMYRDGTHLFADMPVLFDYEAFTIQTWTSEPIAQRADRRIGRSTGKRAIKQAVCIDLAEVHPRFTDKTGSSQSLTETYLWQQWQNEADVVDIALFNSDAVYLHPNTTTIASTTLFFATDGSEEYRKCLDRAARAFSGRLRDTFQNDKLIWLVPDALNDFEIEAIRRNLNARFPGAEPLPRSIAALFEQIDYSRITNDGYSVIVVDTVGGTTCAIKLIARLDADLKNRLPESKGYYWERCPPVTLSKTDDTTEQRYGIAAVDNNGQWYNVAIPKRPPFIDLELLKEDPRIGQFELCITLSNSPVSGGIRLHTLQSSAGDIPLWRDQIPELSVKVMINGRYQRFSLVSRATPVKPIRGFTINIPIQERFELPAGKRFYQFPLTQGSNAQELKHSAKLESPLFPLTTNVVCKLNLSFQYGENDPYTLVFIPISANLPSLCAKWSLTVDEIVTNAPAPDYPKILSWHDLRIFPDLKRGGTIDLIRAITSTIQNFDYWLEAGRSTTIINNIRGWCRFLLFSIWQDGRSLQDNECPDDLEAKIRYFIECLKFAINKGYIKEYDVLILIASMHKDIPDEYIEQIYEQVESDHYYPKVIGFALGDLSELWQQYVFSIIVKNPKNSALDVLAYAVWRHPNFVKLFSLEELKSILSALLNQVKKIEPRTKLNVKPLELLLGLLRTRQSDNDKIKMILQPHQGITKQFAFQIERIEDEVEKNNSSLFSRVQIELKKPEGERTPSLLYALRLFLTGDDGSNAIHILGVSDDDND